MGMFIPIKEHKLCTPVTFGAWDNLLSHLPRSIRPSAGHNCCSNKWYQVSLIFVFGFQTSLLFCLFFCPYLCCHHSHKPQPWSWTLSPQHCTNAEQTLPLRSRGGYGQTDGESEGRKENGNQRPQSALETVTMMLQITASSWWDLVSKCLCLVLSLAPGAATFQDQAAQRAPGSQPPATGAGAPPAHKTLCNPSLPRGEQKRCSRKNTLLMLHWNRIIPFAGLHFAKSVFS